MVQPNLKKIFKKIKLDRNFINTKVQYGRIFRKLIASYKHTTWSTCCPYKPWLTTSNLTLILNKNKICNKFCKAKNNQRKGLLYQRFKTYRDLLSNLTK